MSVVTLHLENELTNLLGQSEQALPQIVHDVVVLELYRRGSLSSGKAAELMKMPRVAFIKHASQLGIALFDMTRDEWSQDSEAAANLQKRTP